jgi:hypothetical protein
VIAGQHVDRRRRDALDVALVLARELLEEVIDQQQQSGFRSRSGGTNSVKTLSR